MRISRIDHVQLAMPAGGEDLARAFYRDILGIPEIPKPPQLRSGGYTLKEDEPLEGYLRIYVDDPFGNRVELMEPAAE
jgi:hypothetical protein